MKFDEEKAEFKLSRREAKATGMKGRRKFPADLEVICNMTTAAEKDIQEYKTALLERYRPPSRQTILCYEKQLAQGEAKLRMMHWVGNRVLLHGYGAAELPVEHRQVQLNDEASRLGE